MSPTAQLLVAVSMLWQAHLGIMATPGFVASHLPTLRTRMPVRWRQTTMSAAPDTASTVNVHPTKKRTGRGWGFKEQAADTSMQLRNQVVTARASGGRFGGAQKERSMQGQDLQEGRVALKQEEQTKKRQVTLHQHPGTRGMAWRELRWQEHSTQVDIAGMRKGLAQGDLCYAQLESGALVRGVLHRIQMAQGEGMAFACIRIIAQGSLRQDWIPVSRIFPVGGCNGGLHAELHRIIQETFRSQYPGDNMSLDHLIKDLQQMRWRPKSSLLMTSSKEPALEAIIEYLDAARLRIMQDPHGKHVLSFPAQSVREARRAFHSSVVIGEQKLQRICELLAHSVFGDGGFCRQSVVIAEIAGADGQQKETFTLTEPLGDDDLSSLMPEESWGERSLESMLALPTSKYYSQVEDGNNTFWCALSLDTGAEPKDSSSTHASHDGLGFCEVSCGDDEAAADGVPAAYRLHPKRLVYDKEAKLIAEGWQHPKLLANYIAYEALTSEDMHSGVYRFFGIRKRCAEIWDNVADRLCRVDAYLDAVSNRGRSSADFVDDVFSVKIIVDDAREARALVEALHNLKFDPRLLRRFNVPFYEAGAAECTEFMEILEQKDDLERERGSWRALRLLVRWWGVKMMLVIEPLEVFHREMERVTPESYGEHKRKRLEVRDKIQSKWPAYSLIRQLLSWMFVEKHPSGMHHGVVSCSTDRVSVVLTE